MITAKRWNALPERVVPSNPPTRIRSMYDIDAEADEMLPANSIFGVKFNQSLDKSTPIGLVVKPPDSPLWLATNVYEVVAGGRFMCRPIFIDRLVKVRHDSVEIGQTCGPFQDYIVEHDKGAQFVCVGEIDDLIWITQNNHGAQVVAEVSTEATSQGYGEALIEYPTLLSDVVLPFWNFTNIVRAVGERILLKPYVSRGYVCV